MACGVCRGGRRPLCSDSFEAFPETASRRSELTQWRAERDDALAQLEAGALTGKEARRGQLLQLQAAEARLAAARSRVDDLQFQLAAVRQRILQQDRELHQRQQVLAAARQTLGSAREQTQRDRSTHMELLGHTYLRNLDTLCREQRHRVVRRAMEILPMTLMPPLHAPDARCAPAPGDHAIALICSLLLPDSRDTVQELTALSPSQLGSALGYAALLLDVLSRFLLLPITHRCTFAGSTSRIWQPASFWEVGGPAAGAALPLFWVPPPAWGEGGLYSAVAAGLSAASTAAPGAGSAAAAADRELARQRQRQELQRALHLLQRSVGTLVYARLGPDAALKIPSHWSPFAWLAGLCKMLAAEPRSAAGGSRPGVPGAGRSLAASAVFGRSNAVAAGAAGLGHSVLRLAEDEEGEEAEDGWEEWEVMPRPSYGRIIPPPPSQPEDVEHWTRAMLDTSAAAVAAPALPATLRASPLGSRLRSLAGFLWTVQGAGGK